MRIGLIARADQRGIGYQTREFMRHMHPERVMVVKMQDSPWETDLSEFPADSLVVDFHPNPDTPNTERLSIADDDLCAWLAELDVLFAVETLYDWRICHMARSVGCKTVVQGNPEFYLHGLAPWNVRPHPDAWWWPTDWLWDRLPAESRVVPVPVPDDAPHLARDPHAGSLVVSFVVGHQAWRDRAGVLVMQDAVRLLSPEIVVKVYCQDPELPVDLQADRKRDSNVMVHTGGVADRWEMYAGSHLLIAPRRYGGLSLPTQEAMAAGLAVAMPDGSPNRTWPVVPLQTMRGNAIHTQGGPVPHLVVNGEEVVRVLHELNQRRDLLEIHQRRARTWAETHSWAALRPTYIDEFARVIG